jgi:hypothetical protein
MNNNIKTFLICEGQNLHLPWLFLYLQAKTLGTGFQKAIPLIHPIMLFKFSAVKNTSGYGTLFRLN